MVFLLNMWHRYYHPDVEYKRPRSPYTPSPNFHQSSQQGQEAGWLRTQENNRGSTEYDFLALYAKFLSLPSSPQVSPQVPPTDAISLTLNTHKS